MNCKLFTVNRRQRIITSLKAARAYNKRERIDTTFFENFRETTIYMLFLEKNKLHSHTAFDGEWEY